MKKCLFISLILLSTLSFSQTIGKVQHIELEKSGDIYTITYNDYKFTQIDSYKSFSFSDLDGLYNKIIEGFESMPEDYNLTLNGNILTLHFEKNMGVKSFRFYQASIKTPEVIGMSRYLTQKQVDKLFGKK